MKKLVVLFGAAFAIACSNGSSDKKADSSTTNNSTSQSDNSGGSDAIPAGISKEDYEKGLNLIATSDCLTCHDISVKKTGPAYQEVAAKYESNDANIDMLADKIIKGGSGNWGQQMMTPHNALSKDDAKAMVKYILSLKNAK